MRAPVRLRRTRVNPPGAWATHPLVGTSVPTKRPRVAPPSSIASLRRSRTVVSTCSPTSSIRPRDYDALERELSTLSGEISLYITDGDVKAAAASAAPASRFEFDLNDRASTDYGDTLMSALGHPFRLSWDLLFQGRASRHRRTRDQRRAGEGWRGRARARRLRRCLDDLLRQRRHARGSHAHRSPRAARCVLRARPPRRAGLTAGRKTYGIDGSG